MLLCLQWRMADIDIQHVPESNRYEARDGDDVVGLLAYETRGDVVVLTHTEVEPPAEGRGVGSGLARTALDDIRAGSKQVDPQCPFVAAWIDRHPDYGDLIAQ